MSHLMDHARAARILGDAFEGQAAQRTDAESALMLMSIATAYRVAADQMMGEIAAEATAFAAGHRCSIDHRTMPGRLCPACGAGKG